MGMAAAKKAVRQIERYYLKKNRNCLYVACEEFDFTWAETEIIAFREMWAKGKPLMQMAIALQRHINEVFILALDQADKELIKTRPGGIFGTNQRESEEDELSQTEEP